MISALPLLVAIVGTVVCMVQIYTTVRRQEDRMAALDARSVYGTGGSGSSSVTMTRSDNAQDELHARTRETAIQAMLYTAAFFSTFLVGLTQVFTGAFLEATAANRTYFFATGLLITILAPLQGLWNLCIYTRPTWKRIRTIRPDYSPLVAFWATLNAHDVQKDRRNIQVQRRSRDSVLLYNSQEDAPPSLSEQAPTRPEPPSEAVAIPSGVSPSTPPEFPNISEEDDCEEALCRARHQLQQQDATTLQDDMKVENLEE